MVVVARHNASYVRSTLQCFTAAGETSGLYTSFSDCAAWGVVYRRCRLRSLSNTAFARLEGFGGTNAPAFLFCALSAAAYAFTSFTSCSCTGAGGFEGRLRFPVAGAVASTGADSRISLITEAVDIRSSRFVTFSSVEG